MSGSVRLRYIGILKWPDMKFLPDLSDQHYDRLNKCGEGIFGLYKRFPNYSPFPEACIFTKKSLKFTGFTLFFPNIMMPRKHRSN